MQKGDSEKIASSIFVCSQAKGCWIMPVVVVVFNSLTLNSLLTLLLFVLVCPSITQQHYEF